MLTKNYENDKLLFVHQEKDTKNRKEISKIECRLKLMKKS